MMTKADLINTLVEEYYEDEEELRKLTRRDLQDLLEEKEDHSDMFPNDDEFDGSHDYD